MKDPLSQPRIERSTAIETWQESVTLPTPEDEHGLAQRLLHACSTAYGECLASLHKDESVKRSTLRSLARGLGAMRIWMEESGANSGQLDHTLKLSESLRALVLTAVLSIARIICTRLYRLDIATSHNREQFLRLSKDAQDILDASDGSPPLRHVDVTAEHQSDDSAIGEDTLSEIAFDLVTDTGSLQDLYGLLQDASIELAQPNQEHCFLDSSRRYHNPFTEGIGKRFPLADKSLVERLGAANLRRSMDCQRMRHKYAGRNVTIGAHDVEQRGAKSFHALTFHDSGIGSSLPSEYVYAASVGTAMSFDNEYAGKVRIPRVPDQSNIDGHVECINCGRQVRVANSRAWKNHITSDLQPYTCFLDACPDGNPNYTTVHDWALHLVNNHGFGYTTAMSCPLCSNNITCGSSAITRHISGHLVEISLQVIPMSMYDDDQEYDCDRDGSVNSINGGGDSPKSHHGLEETAGHEDVGPANIKYEGQVPSPQVGGEPAPVKFKDAIGRGFTFPFDICKTWEGMESLIKQAFMHVDLLGAHVMEGHYDLLGPEGEIIISQLWDTMIKPGYSIEMQMWPVEPGEPIHAQDAAPLGSMAKARSTATVAEFPHIRGSATQKTAQSGFSQSQLDTLETLFAQQQKPSTKAKRRVAGDLDVPIDRINNWYQNRRAKVKQEQNEGANRQWIPTQHAERMGKSDFQSSRELSEGVHQQDVTFEGGFSELALRDKSRQLQRAQAEDTHGSALSAHDDEMEQMIREMEELDRRRKDEERAYAARKAEEKAEQKAREEIAKTDGDEILRRQEREAEALELAREKAREGRNTGSDEDVFNFRALKRPIVGPGALASSNAINRGGIAFDATPKNRQSDPALHNPTIDVTGYVQGIPVTPGSYGSAHNVPKSDDKLQQIELKAEPSPPPLSLIPKRPPHQIRPSPHSKSDHEPVSGDGILLAYLNPDPSNLGRRATEVALNSASQSEEDDSEADDLTKGGMSFAPIDKTQAVAAVDQGLSSTCGNLRDHTSGVSQGERLPSVRISSPQYEQEGRLADMIDIGSWPEDAPLEYDAKSPTVLDYY